MGTGCGGPTSSWGESSGVIDQSASCAGDARAASPSCGGPSPWSCESASTPPIRPFGSCAVTSFPEMGASSGLGACSESENPSARSPSSGEPGLQYPRMAPLAEAGGAALRPRGTPGLTRVRCRGVSGRCAHARCAARVLEPPAGARALSVHAPMKQGRPSTPGLPAVHRSQLPAVRRRFASVRESPTVPLAPPRAASAQSQGPATHPQPTRHGRLNAARGIARRDRHR